MNKFVLILGLSILLTHGDCVDKSSSDDIQREQQERILQEGTTQIGMPAIKNFRERKMLKMIYELRDQADFPTYTYLVSMDSKLIFLCDSIGYGIPYSTQFTNPQKIEYHYEHSAVTIPQADPNGLFSPNSSEGSWVMCKDPNGTDVKPVYIEPRVISSPFKLDKNIPAPPSEEPKTQKTK